MCDSDGIPDEECGNPYKYCNCDKKMNIFRVFTFASLLITVVVLLFTSMPYWFGKTELPSYLRGYTKSVERAYTEPLESLPSTSVHIVTLNTRNDKWCNCGINTIQKYASVQDYKTHVILQTNQDVHSPKFQKYYEVLQAFKSTNADIVLLLDCDVAVTNLNVTVESIANKYDADLIIARDAQWKRMNVPINSGVIIFKRSQWTVDLLDNMSASSPLRIKKYLSGSLKDQPVLTHLLVSQGQLNENPVSEFESHEHVQVVSQRVMNSFFRRGYAFFKTDHENSAWKKGDWLAHVTGSHPDERLKIMNELGACDSRKDFPQVFDSCAVVGSSSVLLNNSHGIDIDSHDAVFRSNFAPIRGFQKDVGSKTTVHICNKVYETQHYIKCIEHFGAEYVVTKLRYWTKSQYDNEYKLFEKYKNGNSVLAPSYSFLEKLNKDIYKTFKPVELSSGSLMFAVALQMCSGKISVYGFDSEEVQKQRRNGQLKQLRYNYYNNKKPAMGFTGTPHKFAMDTAYICGHSRSLCHVNDEYSPLAFEGRYIYIDMGANWCNTLRHYKVISPELVSKNWEIYAFEASPYIQPFVDKCVSYENGNGPKPKNTLPPSGSSKDLARYAPKYNCPARPLDIMRNCMFEALKPELDSLQVDNRFTNMEFIQSRLKEASTPNHQDRPRFTFIPAAVSAKTGNLTLYGSAEATLRGGFRDTPSNGYQEYIVPMIDVVTWIKESFGPGDILVIKMDIEGAEHDIIPKLISEDISINTIAMECHTTGGRSCKNIDQMLRKKNINVKYEGIDYNGYDNR